MKKILSILLLLIILMCGLTACSSVETEDEPIDTGVTFGWRFNPITGKYSYGPTLNGVAVFYDIT